MYLQYIYVHITFHIILYNNMMLHFIPGTPFSPTFDTTHKLLSATTDLVNDESSLQPRLTDQNLDVEL